MKLKVIISSLVFLLIGISVITPNTVEAKSRGGHSYYKSAKTGRFTTKSYSTSHKSTTYKSYFR
jgi:hypothetical protein